MVPTPQRIIGGLPHQFKGSTLEEPPGEKAQRACQAYLQFLKEEAFSQARFKKAAELGTEFLRLAGGWEEACRVLRRTWVENQGDHFQQLHGTFFEGLVDEGLLEKARRNAVEGINAYSTNERTERIRCSPHPSLKDHLEEAAAQLWKDAAKGRALICFDQGDHTSCRASFRSQWLESPRCCRTGRCQTKAASYGTRRPSTRRATRRDIPQRFSRSTQKWREPSYGGNRSFRRCLCY